MLQITWQHFFLFVVFTASFYYLCILLVFFRKEVISVFRRRSFDRNSATGESGNMADILGPVAPNASEEIIEAHVIRFAEDEQIAKSIDVAGRSGEEKGRTDQAERSSERLRTERQTSAGGADTQLLLGSIPDFLSELKTLLSISRDATKEDFFSLFRLICSKYSGIGESHFREVVNLFIISEAKDQLPFLLTSEELNRYWTGNDIPFRP